MFCTNCGAKVAENAKFCEKCGNRIVMGNDHIENKKDEEQQTVEKSTCNNVIYDQAYVQAESGTKSNLYDRVRDSIFSKITKIHVIRVTGEQLALIFKKYFIDNCNDLEEMKILDTVTKLNLAGRNINKNAVVCHSKGKYRWIKDCDKKVIWELKTSLFDKQSFKYRNGVKKFLEEKKAEIEGVPYEEGSFVQIKNKGKIPLAIMAVIVWGIVIWGYATNWGEESTIPDDQNVSYNLNSQIESESTDSVGDSDGELSSDRSTQESNYQNNDSQDVLEEPDYNDNNNDDGQKDSVEDEILEQHDYVSESADGQAEVVLSYTSSRMGKCELYVNYYDDSGNVVNDEYYGTFGENREGEGVLELEGKSETIPYRFDYDPDTGTAYLVLVNDGQELYLAEIQ